MSERNGWLAPRAESNDDEHGFTLIELTVALLIIALLATLAIPTYRNAVIKSKRAEGRAALMQLMQQEERYYSLHTSYLAFSSASTEPHERTFKWHSGGKAESSAYEMSAQACDAGGLRLCVRLIAQAGTDKVNRTYRDPLCGTLSLDSRGEKRPDSEDCW